MLKKVVVLLSIFTVGLAFADEITGSQGAKDFGSEDLGMYGEVQLGAANTSGLNAGVDSAGAGRLDIGFKFSPYMGVEAGMTGLADPSAGTAQANLQFYDVSFKGTLPVTKSFDFHAQAGLAYAVMSAPTFGAASDATAKAMLGFGADLFLTPSFAIVANDYNYVGADGGATSGSGGNTNIVMGGIKYNF